SFLSMVAALRSAEQHVPFYRRRFAEYGVSASQVKAPEDLARFPVLTKEDLRAHGPELVAEGLPRRLHRSNTSGSTGEPARFSYDHHTYELRVAAATRANRWAGAELGEKEAHIWGTLDADEPTWRRLKRRAHDAIQRREM